MKHTLATLAFYAKHPGWHSYDRKCRVTVRAVLRLTALGYLEHDADCYSARFTGKVFA